MSLKSVFIGFSTVLGSFLLEGGLEVLPHVEQVLVDGVDVDLEPVHLGGHRHQLENGSFCIILSLRILSFTKYCPSERFSLRYE